MKQPAPSSLETTPCMGVCIEIFGEFLLLRYATTPCMGVCIEIDVFAFALHLSNHSLYGSVY